MEDQDLSSGVGVLEHRESERGFSIIEMVIAAAVLTIGLVSIVGISAYVSRANTTANTLNVLANTAQDQVDRLRTLQWTASTEDPSLAVGGSVDSVYNPSSSQTLSLSTGEISRYQLDPDNPHRAAVLNTPIGDMSISWQVRQGGVADLRCVTIKVVQIGPSRNLRDGFTVTTMLNRN